MPAPQVTADDMDTILSDILLSDSFDSNWQNYTSLRLRTLPMPGMPAISPRFGKL